VLGKVCGMLGVGARLVHVYETLGKVNVPCPLARETGPDVRRGEAGWMETRDIRRDVLFGGVHRSHRGDGREGDLEGERGRAGSKVESVEGGGLVLYSIRSSWDLS